MKQMERPWLAGKPSAGSTSSYSPEPQRTPELRFSATLGHEPEVELALV
ncbi:MAG: hypothetical protein AVDCRST_MAG93-6876 [uncultured Chloroflexia bacterium]|uniref:Uncharacterized protein n=1 Tax=uncultured Chloroflexia bacterium TaxID=1672391 RepID=A0A6J4LYR7_9CHLR|nr:MAG: hypothetical protein AVDCRST_MAG93-6876 [uncultured Chloroflexia bacterium]